MLLLICAGSLMCHWDQRWSFSILDFFVIAFHQVKQADDLCVFLVI